MSLLKLSCFSIFCCILTSCGFNHLTAIQDQDVSAPTAEECGSCHVEQYAEWRETAHAKAYSSAEFKSQSDDYQEQECLFCHAPGAVLDPARKVRRYNRSEGVTCVSCHLYEQAMQGPHASGALFSPHPIAQNKSVNSKTNSSQLCGVCHEETYAQWRNQRTIKDYPTCHGCHGALLERKDTKGTNFFSNLLVSFEPVHTVRSHYLMLPDKLHTGMCPELQLNKLTADTVQFTLVNNLPHDLPTGIFGEKDLFFILRWRQPAGIDKEQIKMAVPEVLAPGQSQSFRLNIPAGKEGRNLHVDLFRSSHQPAGEAILIGSYLFPFVTSNHSR